jgi:tetratricopeptide (TPR) repeat protein
MHITRTRFEPEPRERRGVLPVPNRTFQQPTALPQNTPSAGATTDASLFTADYYFQEGLILQQNEKWEEAIAFFHKALALNDQLFSVRNNLGNAYFALGRYDEARREYEAALSLNPSYAKAHNNLGNALVELGELEAAIQAFQSAIALDPFYATPHYNLGALYATMGERENALAALRKAIELNTAVKEWLREDPEEYSALQNDEEFQSLQQ